DATPQQNQTVYTFSGIYETQRRYWSGAASGAPYRRAYHCYNGNVTNCETTAVTAPISEKIDYSIPDNNLYTVQKNLFNTLGLPIETDDYYDAFATTGPLKRKTLISYNTSLGNIVNHPASVTVQDGSGNQIAQTAYGYDESAVTPTSGTPQHVAV